VKGVFDVLEIGNAKDVGPDLPLERQVLTITKSEELVKLRALAKLCSPEFFEDSSLSVAVDFGGVGFGDAARGEEESTRKEELEDEEE